jgi:hypothetical protein
VPHRLSGKDKTGVWQIMATSGNKLSLRQRRAIASLLSCRNIQEASKAARVGARTLYRWMSEDTFRTALLHAEDEAIDMATRRLVRLQALAIDELEFLLGMDSTASDGLRLRAAQSVLDYLLKLRELRNIETRLQALEQAVGTETSEVQEPEAD